jgi:hypothetical protein
VSLICRLPDRQQAAIAETRLMRRMANRTLAAVPGGGLVVWSGPSGIGKTITAGWMSRAIEQQYAAEDEHCYRAIHYEVGEIRESSGNQQKQGIRSLYAQVLKSPVPDGIFKGFPAEALAELVVLAMKRRNIRLIFVDEAGCLSLDALRGMVLVRDTAELLEWRSSLVFVGMDDLPIKLERLPQIKRRIEAWCYFEEYGLDETRQLLVALHPHFRELHVGSAALAQQVEYIHTNFGGLPGTIVPFLRQVDARVDEIGSEINLTVLVATHELIKRDRNRAIEDAQRSYARSPRKHTKACGHSPSPAPKRRPCSETVPMAQAQTRRRSSA